MRANYYNSHFEMELRKKLELYCELSHLLCGSELSACRDDGDLDEVQGHGLDDCVLQGYYQVGQRLDQLQYIGSTGPGAGAGAQGCRDGGDGRLQPVLVSQQSLQQDGQSLHLRQSGALSLVEILRYSALIG